MTAVAPLAGMRPGPSARFVHDSRQFASIPVDDGRATPRVGDIRLSARETVEAGGLLPSLWPPAQFCSRSLTRGERAAKVPLPLSEQAPDRIAERRHATPESGTQTGCRCWRAVGRRSCPAPVRTIRPASPAQALRPSH